MLRMRIVEQTYAKHSKTIDDLGKTEICYLDNGRIIFGHENVLRAVNVNNPKKSAIYTYFRLEITMSDTKAMDILDR